MRMVAGRRWTALGSVAGALALVSSTVAGAGVTACGDDCSCIPPEVDVVVPPETANEVTSVAASGVACAGVTAECDQTATNGCIDYVFVPVAAGDCDVTVIYSDGSQLQKTITFGGEPTCCGDLGGGGQIDAIPPTPVADGGAG